MTADELRKHIRTIPDFPKPGIQFRDITTLLLNPIAFKSAIDRLAERFRDSGITKVIGIESRGFLTAAPLAYLLGAGFIPVRKKGKLPHRTNSVSYALEYGEDTLEMHIDALMKDERVLITDDLLATGGTAQATCELVEKSGGQVTALGFLIELADLGGRKRLGHRRVESLITF